MAAEEGVIITLRDIYDEIQMVKGSVQTMEAPVQKIADHEVRIRSLERWRYSQPVTLIAALASIVITLRSNP